MRCCPQCGAVFRRALARCVWDGSELVDSDADLLIGMQVGAYVVDALVGVGGMGRVYRAHHARLEHRTAALKVLLGDLAVWPKMLLRFEKEAQNASRLRHPNIASVWDFGRSERGLLYIAMDFIEGTPLADLLGTAMAPARVIALARKLADALAHAHDLGVIHRDFKPDNIIVAANDVPYVVDFGLAISIEREDDRMTTGGLVMGTPAYLSPEACTCSPIDHRADLYALGVTMYELLTGGVVPFDGAPAQVIGQKAARDPASLATVAPDLPPALVAIVDKLIARDPADRYADARAVIAALDAAAEHADGPATSAAIGGRRDATQVDHTEMLPRARPPWRALALVGVALAGLAVAGVAYLATSGAPARVGVAAPAAAAAPAPAPAAAAAAAPAAAPAAATAPVAAPAPAPAPAPAAAPAIAAAPEPPRSERGRTRSRVAKRAAKAPRAEPAPVAVAAAAPPPPPPELPPPPPPPSPSAIEARIAAVDIDGALPSAVVRRAVDRVGPAIRACRASAPGTLDVRFSIGESRRASATAATGMPPVTAGCVVAAIGGLRTESAPDVGDVAVKLRVAFEQK